GQGELGGEVQRVLHRRRAFGLGADPHHQVVAHRGTGEPVVGLAGRVGAGGRLQVDAAHRAPVQGDGQLGAAPTVGVGGGGVDPVGQAYGPHLLQRHRLGGGRGGGGLDRVLGGDVFDVRQHQPGRGEHQGGDVPANLGALEDRLLVHQVGPHGLSGQGDLQHVGHQRRIVAGALDVPAQVLQVFGT